MVETATRTRDPQIMIVIGQLGHGGAERQLYYLLSNVDLPIMVVCLEEGGYWAEPIRELGIELIELKRRGRLDFVRLWSLYKLVRERRPDVLHLFVDNAGSGLTCRIVAQLVGVRRFIVGERNHPTHHPKWYLSILRLLNTRVYAVICNSYRAREFMAERRLVPAHKLLVIPNAIDVDRFSRRTTDYPWRDDWRGKQVVALIAKLLVQKRPLLFVEAAKRIHQQTPDIRFTIIGDGHLREQVVEKIESFGLTDTFALLGQRNDIPELLNHIDVLLLVSDWEGMPNVLLEAMSVGVPIVTTDGGDSRKLVEESGAGYVVPVGDVESITAQAVHLLENDSLRQEMGQKGTTYAQDFSIGAMVGRYRELYTNK